MFGRLKLSLFIFIVFITFFTCLLPFDQQTVASGEDKLVYIIPIEKEVERGLESFLKRSTEEAKEAGANHIIFEIDTPGGRVDSAGQIGKLLQSLDTQTTAYIVNEALSAGSYIALNSDMIYMNSNATMG